MDAEDPLLNARPSELCFTSPSGYTWLCQLRIGDGATSYHATLRRAPQCGSSSSGRHFSRFYVQPREAKGWVPSTDSSSVRVRERSAGAVAQQLVLR